MRVLHNLLVPIDDSEASAPAIDLALRLARTFDAELCFCNSVDLTGTLAACTSPYVVADAGGILEALESDSKIALDRAVAHAAAAGITAEKLELAGPPVRAILEAVRVRKADGIVMGTHARQGLNRMFVGSVAEGVLRRSEVPMFVSSVYSGSGSFRRIAVALDDSDPADAALAFALQLASRSEATIVLARVIDSREVNALAGAAAPAEISQLREDTMAHVARIAASLRARGFTVETAVDEGRPVECLLDIARRHYVDLIAIGTHGRRGIRRLLVGSVAEGLIRESPVPVVALRAPVPNVAGSAAVEICGATAELAAR